MKHVLLRSKICAERGRGPSYAIMYFKRLVEQIRENVFQMPENKTHSLDDYMITSSR